MFTDKTQAVARELHVQGRSYHEAQQGRCLDKNFRRQQLVLQHNILITYTIFGQWIRPQAYNMTKKHECWQ
jgi:hypothetical protein